MTPRHEIWIGLAEVIPAKGSRSLDGAKGAFVNVVGWASSNTDFHTRVEEAAVSLDMQLLALEDAEPFSQRHAKWDVDELILQMVGTAQEHEKDIVFGTFHLWDKTDA